MLEVYVLGYHQLPYATFIFPYFNPKLLLMTHMCTCTHTAHTAATAKSGGSPLAHGAAPRLEASDCAGQLTRSDNGPTTMQRGDRGGRSIDMAMKKKKSPRSTRGAPGGAGGYTGAAHFGFKK